MTRPRLSIGMPVYNGERFIEQAIRSLQAQTFSDFELIVSDNASEDRTEQVCRGLAEGDPRVRYIRNASNLGAARNYNRVYELSRGELFMWCAHDDMHESSSLQKCVDVLDAAPDVVLVYPALRDIDDQGNTVDEKKHDLDAASPRPAVRFESLIRNEHTCEAVFGITRSAILKQTPLIGGYVDSDRVLLANLALWGRFHEVPEFLFLHRVHSGSSVSVYDSRQTRTAWFDPARSGKPAFPYTRQFFAYLAVIHRSPLRWRDRFSCWGHMLRWLGRNKAGLLDDLNFAGRHVLRPWKRRVQRLAGGGDQET